MAPAAWPIMPLIAQRAPIAAIPTHNAPLNSPAPQSSLSSLSYLARHPWLPRLFPFLLWWPFSRDKLRADAVAGLTVAMVLVPQSMAYAQLAGMPPYYGLYAAFLPVLIGALWGSSHQLATGPVAMVSLLTGATLARFAAPGSDQFITLAIALALTVGVMELALGLFRLGAIVNFLSHPVIVGFTNAAAIIIALSQLGKLLGVSTGSSNHFLVDIWSVLRAAGDTHWPTLAMGLFAFAIMLGLRHYLPKWPGVLVAVTLTTLLSWGLGFERNTRAELAEFGDLPVRVAIETVMGTSVRLAELDREIAGKQAEIATLTRDYPEGHPRILALDYDVDVLRFESRIVERERAQRLAELKKFKLVMVTSTPPQFHLEDLKLAAAKTDGRTWRVSRMDKGTVHLAGGGEVVGAIPPGLPSLAVPKLSLDMLSALFSTALVITLVGFMEAVSVAKSMATITRQRIDPNQELIGQGLANIVGSFCKSFPVSGSFSRSAVNLTAGALTGMSSVVTAVIVLVTLLLFTPLLYHLPQAVLAAVIMMAVINLVNFKAILHAWKAHKHDGVAAVVTFVATLGFAPHLDTGLLVGAGLAIVLYLYRTMRPRVVILSRHADGTLRDSRLFDLPTSEHIIAIRFDGSLYFANVPYFEDAILAEAARNPKAQYILVVSEAINEIDGSGEEVIRHLVTRLRERGLTMVFSGMKLQVMNVLRRTALYEAIGAENFFNTEDAAIETIFTHITDPEFDAAECPLRMPMPAATTEI